MLLARIILDSLETVVLFFPLGGLAFILLMGVGMPAFFGWLRRRSISRLGELWAQFPIAEPMFAFGPAPTPASQRRWKRWKGGFWLVYLVMVSVGVVIADQWYQRLNLVAWVWLMALSYVVNPRWLSINRLYGPLLVGQHGLMLVESFIPWSDLREVRVDSHPGASPEAPTRVVLRLAHARGEVWLTARDAREFARLVVERVSPSLCPGIAHAQAG